MTQDVHHSGAFLGQQVQGKMGPSSAFPVQEGFSREDLLPGGSPSHTCLPQLGPRFLLYRTCHMLIFPHYSLPFTSDFNPADFDYLQVSSEIKDLFEYIKR